MRKVPAHDWPNPTNATVRLPEGQELAEVQEVIRRLLGNDASPGDVAHMVGALDGFDQTLDELENGTDNADDVRKGTPAAFPEVARAIRDQFGDEVKSIRDLLVKEGGL